MSMNTALDIPLVIANNKLLEQCKSRICFIFLSSKEGKVRMGLFRFWPLANLI